MAYQDQSDDVHWLRPETAGKIMADDGCQRVLYELLEAGGEATVDELSLDAPGHDPTAVVGDVQALFEADVVDYELDEDDVEATTVSLAHDSIRVQPLVLDGERPTAAHMLAEMTGRPKAEFEYDGPVPDLEDLETERVPAEEYHDDCDCLADDLEERADGFLEGEGEVADADDVKDAFQTDGDADGE